MREIKFRAWDKKWKKMISSFEINNFSSAWANEGSDGNELLSRYSDFELMQFTSLKDKNGKEIYDGDIVEFIQEQGQIIFEEGCFKFKQTKALSTLVIGEIKPKLMSNYAFCEVIGNIYEHL